MVAKKAKAGQQAAPATPTDYAETLSLLTYGAGLHDAYVKQSAADANACCMRLQRFGDYLEHFGFAPGRELAGAAHPRAGEAPPAPEPLWGTPVEGAGWGIPTAERDEADAHCAQFIEREAALAGGAAPPPLSVSAVTARLTAAYAAPTWRQSPQQCELKRVRVVFKWLCHRLTCIRLTEAPAAADGGSATAAVAAGANGKGKPSAQPAESTAGAGARGKSTKSAKGSAPGTAVVVAEGAPPPPPPDPLQVALDTRSCTPAVAARLLQAMLACAGVEAEVVVGLVKGASPEESAPWAWNCVTVGGKRCLVDVASAVFSGVVRSSSGPAAAASSTASAPAAAATSASAAPPAPPAAPLNSRATPPPNPAPTAAEAALSPPLPPLALSASPLWREPAPEVALAQRADFHFLSDPTAFLYTHLPADPTAALLTRPPNRAVWEGVPRLTERFFAHPVRLRSHPRTCRLSVRASPFYVTVVNDRPDTTELCGAVYPCSLQALPDVLATSSPADGLAASPASRGPQPLGAQWVWHQRRESTGEETFTVTVPEAGYYSFVIGARSIRSDPYGCRLPAAEGGFTPIVRYQARVNFSPSASPVLPRQHVSPCIARLLAPLTQQVQAGTHTFTVMPTCSNVLAVAVVAVKGGPASGRAAEAEVGGAAPATERRLLRFLPFYAAEAAYTGDVELCAGDRVEVWVRYGAPDHNGLTLAERVAVEGARRPPSPPPPPPPATSARPGSKAASAPRSSVKRGAGTAAAAATAEVSSQEPELRALSRRLAAAEVFIPAFSGIVVCRMAPAETAALIQPQPTVAEERDATLRRLSGVTARLYDKAAQLEVHQPPAVGSFFTAHPKGMSVTTKT